MQRTPIRVTFDTNAYSPVTRPQLLKIITTGWPLTPDRLLSKKRRIAWWYIGWCIRRGRIIAGIPEAAFAAEVMPHVDRVAFIAAVGTPKVTALMNIPPGRRDLIHEGFAIGFRALKGPRIAYGDIVGIKPSEWASGGTFTLGDIQNRQSKFVRHFNEYPLEALRDFGEKMAATHGLGANNRDPSIALAASMNKISIDRFLWREGLVAERNAPKAYPSREAFDAALRHLLADWADFDMAAIHYAYGYDYLCTEDTGKPRSDSIFGSTYASDLSATFGLQRISLSDLASLCWSRFGLPFRKWRN